MSKRPFSSVILQCGRQVWRGDIAAADATELQRLETMDLEAATPLPALVETVARRSGPLGSRVLLLSSELWTQVIRLPLSGVSGLPKEELTKALTYEVESLTGIASDETSLVFQRIGDAHGDGQFWVTVAPQMQIDETFQFLKSQGVRAVSLSHPAGASADVRGEAEPSSYCEFWPGLIAEFAAGRGELVAIVQGASAMQKRRDELAAPAESAETGQPMILWGPHAETPAPAETARMAANLNDNMALRTWMLSIARKKSDFTPHWSMTRKRNVGARRWLAAAAAFLLAVGVTGAHGYWMWTRNQVLAEQRESLNQLILAQQSDDAELTRLANERAALSESSELAAEQLQLLTYFLDNQVGRLDKLLVWLLQLRTEDLVIRELKPNERGMSIAGMSLNSESAPQLANQLRDLALPMGWRVQLATQIGAKTLVSGGPWEFELVLEDVGPRGTTSSVMEADRKGPKLARQSGGSTRGR